MSTLATMVVKLVGDIGDFVGGMDKAAKKAEETGGSILSSIGGGLQKVAGIAAGAAVAGIGAATAAITGSVVAVNQWAGELDSLGDVLGTSANESAALAVAIRGVGGDVGAITGQMAKFVGGLRDGNGKLSEGGKLMEKLGVSFADANGNLLPTTDILTGIADKFATMPDGLQKTEMLTTLFGKSGKELGDTLNSLANGGLAAAEQKAQALGLAIGDDGVNRSIEFQKGLATIQMAAQGLVVSLGNELMPVIVPLIQKFAEWAVSVMPQVVEGIKTVVAWAKDNLVPAFETVVKWATDNLVPALQTVAKWLQDNLVPAFESVVKWVTDNWPAIQKIVEDVFAAVKGVIDSVVVPVFDFIIKIAGEVVKWVQDNWPLIQKTAETVFDAIKNVINTVMPILKQVVETAFNAIKTTIETVLNVVKGIITTVMQIINGDWEGAWNTVKTTVEGIWEGIKTFISTVTDGIFKLLGTSWDNIKTQVESKWNLIKAAVVDAWGNVQIFFNNLPGQLIETGRNIIQGIVNGINQAADWVRNALSGIINGAIDSIKRTLGIASPSRVFTGFGEDMMVGLAQGIRRAGDLPEVQLRGTLSDITGAGQASVGGAGGGAGAVAGGAPAYVTVNFYGQVDSAAARDGTVEGLRKAGLVVVS